MSEPRSAATYARLAPGCHLLPFVEAVWVQDNPTSAATHEFPPTRAIPTGFVDVAFYYRDAFFEVRNEAIHRLDDVVVSGPQTRHRLYGALGKTGIIVVRFWPGMASRFLHLPLIEMRDLNISLRDALPARIVNDIPDRLREAPDIPTRVKIVQEFVGSLLDRTVHRSVLATVRQVLTSGGNASLRSLADTAGVSPRQLQRNFREQVGMGPKALGRIVRFQTAIDQRRGGASWAAAAHASGYSDQAHFANECKRLTGITPSELWSRRTGTPLAEFFNECAATPRSCGTVYA